MTDILAQISELPAADRKQFKADLTEQVLTEIVLGAIDDPCALSLDSLVSIYRARVNSDLKGIVHRPPTRHDAKFARSDDVRAEMVRRLELVQYIGADESRQRAAMEACRGDVKRLFDDYLFMLDPRGSARACPYQPFKLFEFQRETLDWITERYEENESGLIEKSRDMGLSVLCVGFGFHKWIFERGTIIGYGSRKENLVHKSGDMDSLLEKVKILLEYLPKWMVPEGYSEHRHFNHLNIRNPATGSQMKGEGGDQLGRGGRATVYFADEFSYVLRQEATEQALSGTTDCVIYLGTSAGPNTHMATLKRLGVYPVLSLPWVLDPRKMDNPADVGDRNAPSKWRDRAEKKFEAHPHLFAREFDCDDSKAIANLVIPIEWVRAAVDIKYPDKVDDSWLTLAGQDLAYSDQGDESVLIIRSDGWVRLVEAWRGKSPEESAAIAMPLVALHRARQISYDNGGQGASFGGAARSHAAAVGVRVEGINAKMKPTPTRYPDAPKLPANKRFRNRMAELWWSMRIRFQKSYERHHDGVQHPWDECIKIPDDEELIRQLANRPYREDSYGKIELISKRELAQSPDRADALAFSETKFKKVRRR